MKKSFAENCIRYISTATALILALAMLCCANFSASAKDLGSNLTITDTTLLLQDINTTTNTTPAKTKDLIASGANVDVVSTGISGTYYLDLSDNYTNWEDKRARFAICTYTTENNNRNYIWYNMEKVSGEDHIYKATVNDSNYYINFARMNPDTTENNWTNKWNDTGDLTPETGKNCYKVKSGAWDKGGGTWSTYSSSTTYTVTFNYKGHGTNTYETVNSNTQINAPTEPTATGYTFDGWYTDESLTTEATFPYTVTSNVTFYAKWTENASSTVSADIISVLKEEKIMFYIGNSWGSKTMYHRTSKGSSTDNGTSTSSTVEINKVTCNYGVVCDTPKQYYISNSSWAGLQLSATAEAGKFYILNTSPSLGGSNNNIYVSPVSGSASGSATTKVTDTTVSTTFTSSASGIGSNYDLVYYIKSGATYYKIATSQDGANSYIASADDGDYTLYTCLTDGNITVLKDTDTFTKSSVVKYDVNVHYNGKGGNDYTSKIEENTDFPVPTSTSVEGYTLEGWYTTSTFDTGTKVTFPLKITGNTDLYAKWEQNAFKHKYVFLDVSDKGWFYADSCVGVVSFDGGTKYYDMQELFTNTSTYNSEEKSNLLFAEVPEGTKTITFARNNNTIEDGKVKYHNPATYKYADFGENNLLKLDSADNTLSGTWSTVDYTPVPIDFTVGENGKVYLNNDCVDSNNNPVDMPITSGTIYADKSATSLKVKATPNTGYEVNVLKVNGAEKSVGGTVDVGTLGDTNTVEVTFKASQSPKIKVIPVANSSIRLSYTDPDGTTKIGTKFDTEYKIQYNSSFTLEITPASGYYVKSVSNNLTPTDTLPKAGTITATASQIKTDLIVSYELAENPTVTIECYDSSGNKLSEDSGVGITVDGVTGVNTTQTKTVLYKDSTGATFTASVADSHKNNYVFLGYYNTPSAAGNKYANGGYNDHDVTVTDDSIKAYDVTVTDDSIKVYNVCSNRTIYAIFAQLYEVKFSYKNLSTFTVNSKAVANGGAVYVKEGTSLSLATTFDEDYKMTNDCWEISPTGVGTFTRNASNATYVVGNKNVEITITPEIATYRGQGKWGSRLLRINAGGVMGDNPWFAAKFEVVKDSNTTYEWVRFSEVKKDNYECVIPDNATRVEFCRMKPDAKAFSTDGVWNVTSTTLGNSDEKYILYFDMTDSSNWVFKCRKDTSG